MFLRSVFICFEFFGESGYFYPAHRSQEGIFCDRSWMWKCKFKAMLGINLWKFWLCNFVKVLYADSKSLKCVVAKSIMQDFNIHLLNISMIATFAPRDRWIASFKFSSWRKTSDEMSVHSVHIFSEISKKGCWKLVGIRNYNWDRT